MDRVPTGYRLADGNTLLFQSGNSVVVRCIRESDGEAVICKCTTGEFPPEEQIIQINKDYDVSQLLANISGVLSTFERHVYQNKSVVLVKEDFGAIDLKQYIQTLSENKLSIEEFLEISIKLISILSSIHQRRILHLDIKPQNVLINKDTKELKVCDFSISEILSVKQPYVELVEGVINGTLHFTSPEQTGKMAHSKADTRSDIYSLGATFYYLLSGTCPFDSNDPMEIIHAHMAKSIEPLIDVPEPIQQVIQKMMEKEQSARYQSMRGIQKDLEYIRNNNIHNISNEWKPAQNDVSDTFKLSNKLYGRDNEIQLLNNVVHIVRMKQQPALTLISGFSGIGKSVLVQQLVNIYGDNILFSSGKFDQINRGSPFSAIITSMIILVERALGESKTYLSDLKLKLLETLKGDGSLLVEMIPQLELIIGKQIPLTNITGTELTNRLFNAVTQFFKVFSSNYEAICLFIDDLQWADLPSLQLIEHLLSGDCKEFPLMFIGAYRDNEVDASHPLQFSIDNIQKKQITPVIDVQVSALQLQDLNSMLSDSLHLQRNETMELAQLVLRKTQGNPFFSREFLLTLHKQELLTFDYEREKWTWNMDDISQQNFSENVVDFMLANLMTYKKETQEILRYAACLGNIFELHELANVTGKTNEETKAELLEALHEGWIMNKINGTYKFLHDRLQQAAYDSMPESQRIFTHYQLGTTLLKRMTEQNNDTMLFDVLSHLNLCHSTIISNADNSEVIRLIELNIVATKKALDSSASEPALVFSGAANNLLESLSYDQVEYELRYKAKSATVESMVFAKKFETAIPIAKEMILLSQNRIHKFKALQLLLECQNSLSNYEDSYDVVVQVVEENPDYSRKLTAATAGQWLQTNLPDIFTKLHQYANIIRELPTCSDELEIVQFAATIIVGLPSFFLSKRSSKYVFSGVMALLGEIAIDNGICYYSIISLSAFAVTYTTLSNDWTIGNKLVSAVYELADRIKSDRLLCNVCFFAGVYAGVVGTITDQIELYRNGFLLGVRTGEHVWGSYCAKWYMYLCILQGGRVSDLISTYSKVNDYIMKLGSDLHNTSMIQCHWILQCFKGELDEYRMEALPLDINAQTPFIVSNATLFKAVFNYYIGRNTEALEDIRRNDKYLEAVGIFFFRYHHVVMKSLIVAEELSRRELSDSDREVLLSELTDLREILYEYTKHFERYLKAAYYLSEAELMVHDGKSDAGTIIKQYQQAIQLANETNYSLISSVATTRLAQYLDEQQFGTVIVSGYAIEALKAWTYMGADIKVAQVRSRFSYVLSSYNANNISYSGGGGNNDSDVASTISGGTLMGQTINSFSAESRTALKVSELYAKSDEMDLTKLFIHMMPIINENTGAERTCLIFKSGEDYQFTAEISVQKPSINMIEKDLGQCSSLLCIQLLNRVINARKSVLVSDASTNNDFKIHPYIEKTGMKSIMCTPIIYQMDVVGLVYLENSKLTGVFTDQRALILKTIIDVSIENTMVFSTLNSAYARFLPKPFLQQLNKETVTQVIAGDAVEKNMCVMFSDIRNFTSITEKMTAKRSFSFVNQFLEYIAPEIDNQGGFIDKFIGDAVMALFPNNINSALKAAIGMVSSLKEFNLQSDLDFDIKIGIGLHYGQVMLGTVGYSARLNATVISDTVNIASRLEALTKNFNVGVLVSHNVIEAMEPDDTIAYRKIGKFILKGKEFAHELYEVYDCRWDHSEEKYAEFSSALDMFYNGKLIQSQALITRLQRKYPDDSLFKFYQITVELLKRTGVPPNWKGEIKLDKDGNPLPFKAIIDTPRSAQEAKDLREALNRVRRDSQMVEDESAFKSRRIAELEYLVKQLSQQQGGGSTGCLPRRKKKSRIVPL
jgi:class 3 adenylate cyclase/serine/threonine protein kinase